MPLTAQPVEQISKQTHEPTGVTVHFRRLGHVARSRLAASTGGDFGRLYEELVQPGVGVLKWEGVKREISAGKDKQLVDLPYSVEALDAVAQTSPEFGVWFNDTLISVNGFDAGASEAEAMEGKSEAPATG